MNYENLFYMKKEGGHIPKEKNIVEKCQRRHPFQP
jgi:hypothetical protein